MSAQLRQEFVRSQTVRETIDSPLRRHRTSRRSGRRRAAIGLVMLIVCGAAGLGTAAARHQAPSDLQLVRKSTSGQRVFLLSAGADRRLGFVTVTGSVANHTGRSIAHVEAVVELLDDRGRTVGLESALLAFDTLRTGEEAPFQVEMQDQARAATYRIRFRQLMGPSVD